VRLILGLLLALFTLQPTASQYWAAGAFSLDDTQQVTGVRSTFEVKRIGGKSQKAAWMAATVGHYWVQAGWQNWGGPKVVVMCFDLDTMQQGCPGTDYFAHPEMVSGTMSTFEIVNVPGSTLWEVYVDGILTSRYDFGETYAVSGQVDIEQSPSDKPERFPVILFSPALEFQKAGEWVDAPSATRDGRSGGGVWGVEGMLQNPSLGPNQIQMGSGAELTIYGTSLW